MGRGKGAAIIRKMHEKYMNSLKKYNENALDKSNDHVEIRLQASSTIISVRASPTGASVAEDLQADAVDRQNISSCCVCE